MIGHRIHGLEIIAYIPAIDWEGTAVVTLVRREGEVADEYVVGRVANARKDPTPDEWWNGDYFRVSDHRSDAEAKTVALTRMVQRAGICDN